MTTSCGMWRRCSLREEISRPSMPRTKPEQAAIPAHFAGLIRIELCTFVMPLVTLGRAEILMNDVRSLTTRWTSWTFERLQDFRWSSLRMTLERPRPTSGVNIADSTSYPLGPIPEPNDTFRLVFMRPPAPFRCEDGAN